MNEEQYSKIIDSLTVGTDMRDEVSRRMAYNACLTYAEREISFDPDVNLFVSLAAERLEQLHVYFDVIKNMVQMPENARLRLRYTLPDDPDPTLTGNTEGLRYLSSLCTALISSPPLSRTGSEDHVHLNAGEPPMIGNSYGLTVYHSADNWFDRFANPPEDAEEVNTELPLRQVLPEQIAAIEFLKDENVQIPPFFYLRHDKLYRVLDFRSYSQKEEVPVKPIESGNEDRLFVFTIRDDAQELFDIALHLDDPSLHYFTKSDLEQVWRDQEPCNP